MTIQYIAPFLDHSGYGEASRNTLMAMSNAGIQISTKIVSFTGDELNVGKAAELAIKNEKKYLKYDINLIELTPEHYPYFIEPHCYNIGYFFWEVKGVDKRWIDWCNMMDEIWLPSPLFAKMFKQAGIKRKINIVPCCMAMPNGKISPFKLPIKRRPSKIFYSIFQWTERKNPKALLQTYWSTFQGIDDVSMIIKTYRSDFSSRERSSIKKEISCWKRDLNQKHYPKLWMVLEDMSYDEIMRLHATGDIFVSTHRGEGWGYSQMTAMAFGKLIVSTNFGGIHEYLTDKTALLPRSHFTPVFGMEHIEWYNNTQMWADIDINTLARDLKIAYDFGPDVNNIAKRGCQLVREKFSYESVGKEIAKLLININL